MGQQPLKRRPSRYSALIPSSRETEAEDFYEFEASLVYILNLGQPGLHCKTL